MMSHITLSLIWAVYGTSAAIPGYLLFLYMRRERELKREREAILEKEDQNYKDIQERTLSLHNPAMPPVPQLEHVTVAPAQTDSTPAELELCRLELIRVAPYGQHIGTIQWIEGDFAVIDTGCGKLFRLPLSMLDIDHVSPAVDKKVIDIRVDAAGRWRWQLAIRGLEREVDRSR